MFPAEGSQGRQETVTSLKCLFTPHVPCGSVSLSVIVSGSNLFLEKLELMNYCAHLSKKCSRNFHLVAL